MQRSKLIVAFFLGAVVCGQVMAQSCTPKVSAEHLVVAGELQMSINPTLPPQQFVDDKGELQGLNVELGRAVAQQLCLKPVFVRMDMPAMVPALQSRRFDAINTGLFWTEERSKTMFMVPYGQQAMSIFTIPSSKFKITKFEDLSGHVVGIETGTYQERKSREFNALMVKNGLKPIEFRTFETASETTAALRAGQLEAAINSDDTARSYVEQGIVKIWVSGIYGTDITLDFRDKTLALAVSGALKQIESDGVYSKLFEKFKMTPLKDPTFDIRGPGPSSS